ncbi:MAG: thiolase family protein [Oligoflexia bacterium]|nr:thiolase family protein [Oligoflexia bacterium]
MSQSVVIVSSTRTPIGTFQGALSALTAPQLGSLSIKAAIERAGINPDLVNEVIMGNVLTAGVGQAPTRQAAIFAGLPNSVACMTINKVCGSGLKAVMLAAQAIQSGDAEVIVAGGQENMSLTPHLLEKSRLGFKMGHAQLTDSMIKDGLWDVYNNYHMGNAAELCAREKTISREDQDQFAIESYKRSQKATESGLFKQEITPVSVQQPNSKEQTLFEKDEEPFKVKFEKIPTLKPAFDKQGSVTAANASSINDGSAAHVVMSEARAKALGLKPLVRIVGQASAAQAPEWFTTAPAKAMNQVLKKTGLTLKDIDVFEVNEAFSVVALACIRELGLDAARVNPLGGAVSLGHPIGASGARILTTLIHTMKREKLKRGMASICIGGGEASAVILERID